MNIDFARYPAAMARFDAGYGSNTRNAPEVSVAGVVLLSALAVVLTIIGVVMLGVVVVAAWWLLSHIPVPPVVWRALTFIHW